MRRPLGLCNHLDISDQEAGSAETDEIVLMEISYIGNRSATDTLKPTERSQFTRYG